MCLTFWSFNSWNHFVASTQDEILIDTPKNVSSQHWNQHQTTDFSTSWAFCTKYHSQPGSYSMQKEVVGLCEPTFIGPQIVCQILHRFSSFLFFQIVASSILMRCKRISYRSLMRLTFSHNLSTLCSLSYLSMNGSLLRSFSQYGSAREAGRTGPKTSWTRSFCSSVDKVISSSYNHCWAGFFAFCGVSLSPWEYRQSTQSTSVTFRKYMIKQTWQRHVVHYLFEIVQMNPWMSPLKTRPPEPIDHQNMCRIKRIWYTHQ